MKPKTIPQGRARRYRAFTLAGLMISAVILGGCERDWTIGPPKYRYRCGGEVTLYGAATAPVPPTTAVTKNHGDPSAKGWTKYTYKSGNKVRFYTDRDYLPTSDNPMLKGAFLLQLASTDRTIIAAADAGDHFLKLDLAGRDVDRLWIAFDTRATTAPTWLTTSFKKVQPDRFIESSQSYPLSGYRSPAGTPTATVRYQLWEPNTDITALVANDIYLGGTAGPGAVWLDSTVGAQYPVIVRVRPTPDPSTKQQVLGSQRVEVEASSISDLSSSPQILEQGKDEAMQLWLAKDANKQYAQAYSDGLIDIDVDPSKCNERCEHFSDQGWVCKQSPELTTGPAVINSWFLSSTANIDVTKSSAKVEVSGYAPKSGALVGTLDFDLDRNSNARIGGVDLWGSKLVLGDGTEITELTLGQNATIVAECADTLPPGPFRLCGSYRIPAGATPGFRAGAAAKIDGDDVTVALSNIQPMDLSIDFTTMSYLLTGGPLQGSIETEDGLIQVEITLRIAGDFLNLAPVASAEESVLEWECDDLSTADVTLSASASFDELIPTDIVSYDWVEDAGLLTHTSLGTQQSITTTMAFGRHNMTLFVTDSFGISSSTRFAVDVVDSQIDSISVPPDVWVLKSPSGSTPVALGWAGASDVCSSAVLIDNDAPASSSFPEGYSQVNWSFDDQRGNLEIFLQKVFVIAPEFFLPPISEVLLDNFAISDGGALQIVHDSHPQGRTVFADAYLALYGPDGSRWWVTGEGHLVPGVEALVINDAFGAAYRSDVLFDDVFPAFAGSGLYTAEASLVQPGADPLDNTGVLARGWASFELEGPPEPPIFADGFESAVMASRSSTVP